MSMYGVTQMNHGADHRWIFSEEDLREDIYSDEESIPDEDEVDCWPIGGSNCGASILIKLDTDEEIKSYLIDPGMGPDVEDPELVDLAEYYCEADYHDHWCYKSSTRTEMERLGITWEETQSRDSRYEEAEQMIRELQEGGYSDFDYENPFYGENRDMRFSELCDLHEKICKQTSEEEIA